MLQQGTPPAQALARLGQQFFLERRFAEAAALFRLAVTLAPDNSVLWTNYGTALDCAGSFAEAAACLQHSLAISPEEPDTWLLLGLVKKKMGDLEGCEHAYRTASRQAPKSSAVWECLALLQEERREYAQAIDSLENAMKLGSTNAAIAANLGKLCYQLGRTQEACDAYARAVRSEPGNGHYQQMARKAAFVRDVLRGQSVDDALAAYERSMAAAKQEPQPHAQLDSEPGIERDTEKESLDLLQAAFGQLSGFGHLDAASRVGEKYLQLQPGNAEVPYLMKAIKGESSLDRSPEDYIAEHFDSFADGFDAKLIGVLGYDVPEKLCSAVRRIAPAGRKYNALDAGCGTGLCAPLLRPIANRLTGVDLAPKMLEQAAKRGLYDELLREELTSFLNRSPLRFDLIVAADVAIYIGDLLPVFSGAANAIQPGGLLAFSTEFWSGEGYRLQPSGRFAHSPAYVRSLAAPHFHEQICEGTTIRLEAGSRVPGHLFVFVKNPL